MVDVECGCHWQPITTSALPSPRALGAGTLWVAAGGEGQGWHAFRFGIPAMLSVRLHGAQTSLGGWR